MSKKYRVTLSIHYDIYADDEAEARKIEKRSVPNIGRMLVGMEKKIEEVKEDE